MKYIELTYLWPQKMLEEIPMGYGKGQEGIDFEGVIRKFFTRFLIYFIIMLIIPFIYLFIIYIFIIFIIIIIINCIYLSNFLLKLLFGNKSDFHTV